MRWLVCIAALVVAGCVLPPPAKQDPGIEDFAGRWVGKWDDTWCVQFNVTPSETSPQARVVYEWEETVGQPLWRQAFEAKLKGAVLDMDGIEMRLSAKDRDEAFAYGKFPKPRSATLKRSTTRGCAPP